MYLRENSNAQNVNWVSAQERVHAYLLYYSFNSAESFFPQKYEFMRKYTSELFQCGTL